MRYILRYVCHHCVYIKLRRSPRAKPQCTTCFCSDRRGREWEALASARSSSQAGRPTCVVSVETSRVRYILYINELTDEVFPSFCVKKTRAGIVLFYFAFATDLVIHSATHGIKLKNHVKCIQNKVHVTHYFFCQLKSCTLDLVKKECEERKKNRYRNASKGNVQCTLCMYYVLAQVKSIQ